MSLFSKYSRNVTFLYKYQMSLFSKIFIGLDFSIRDLIDLWGVGKWDLETNIFPRFGKKYLSKIWKKLKQIVPKTCRGIVPIPFLCYLPLFVSQFLFLDLCFHHNLCRVNLALLNHRSPITNHKCPNDWVPKSFRA